MSDGPVATSSQTVYPDALQELAWWVCWVLDGKGRKRPVAPWKTGTAYPVEWRNTIPDEDRPETTFDTAHRWAGLAVADLPAPDDIRSDQLGLGLILPTDRPPVSERIVLVDWDNVRDPQTEALHPAAAAYVSRAGTYAELSQSGTGLHQFVFAELPDRKKRLGPIADEPWIGDELPAVEMYDGGRHVAMTGQHVDGTPTEVLR